MRGLPVALLVLSVVGAGCGSVGPSDTQTQDPGAPAAWTTVALPYWTELTATTDGACPNVCGPSDHQLTNATMPPRALLTGVDLVLERAAFDPLPELPTGAWHWRVSCLSGGAECPTFAAADGTPPLRITVSNLTFGPGVSLRNRVWWDSATPTSAGQLQGAAFSLRGNLTLLVPGNGTIDHRDDRILLYTGTSGACAFYADPKCNSFPAGTRTTVGPLYGNIDDVNLTVTWTSTLPDTASLTFRMTCSCSTPDLAARGPSPLHLSAPGYPISRGASLVLFLGTDPTPAGTFGPPTEPVTYHVDGRIGLRTQDGF